MSVETLTPPVALPPEVPIRRTSAAIADRLRNVVFYGLLGLGICLPPLLAAYGALFR